MNWLKANLGWLLGGGAVATLLIFWQRIWAAVNSFLSVRRQLQANKDELHVTEQALLVKRTVERDGFQKECVELRRQLADRIREDDAREDIHKQDRATIRALKRLLDEHRIDYSEVEEDVRRAMMS